MTATFARRLLFGAYSGILLVLLGAAMRSPGTFSKINSFERANFAATLAPIEPNSALDVHSVIHSIPYATEAEMVWEVDPAEKYRRTI